MSFNVERAIRSLEKRDSLRAAEQNAAWVIRRSKTTRIRSKNECAPAHHDALSCFHGNSYTMPCAKCRRTQQDADIFIAQLKLKLSIA
jgi:7-cyano-7-deazaguanine synthase in queuosine biosynthesis